jgi:hypothetical protein
MLNRGSDHPKGTARWIRSAAAGGIPSIDDLTPYDNRIRIREDGINRIPICAVIGGKENNEPEQ